MVAIHGVSGRGGVTDLLLLDTQLTRFCQHTIHTFGITFNVVYKQGLYVASQSSNS